ncbi:site-2 protease family protein [candidate division KSB1 bacterium]
MSDQEKSEPDFKLPPYNYELPRYREIRSEDPVRTKKPPNPKVNLILFILTVFSTLLAGAYLEGYDPFIDFRYITKGFPFAFTLLLIIGFHEFGHYFMCKRHGVPATLPYFIPAPPPIFLIGTLGAVIKIRAPITNSKSLFDIGAAGPIAGFLVTVPAMFIGLKLSYFGPDVMEVGYSLGDPLFMKIAGRIILGETPAGADIYIHSIAFAGWVGLIVTAFNLLPIGQLDGGHIAYALLGKRQVWLGYTCFFMLFPLMLLWTGWLIIIIIALLIRIRHPVFMTGNEPVGSARKLIGFICLIIFIISFIPVPFKGMGLLNLF